MAKELGVYLPLLSLGEMPFIIFLHELWRIELYYNYRYYQNRPVDFTAERFIIDF